MTIEREEQNPYAYKLMCFMDLLTSMSQELYKSWLDKKDIQCSEDLFFELGILINKCEKFDNPTIDCPRYELWEEFIKCELMYGNQYYNIYKNERRLDRYGSQV